MSLLSAAADNANRPLWTGLLPTPSSGEHDQPARLPVSKPGLATRLPADGGGAGVGVGLGGVAVGVGVGPGVGGGVAAPEVNGLNVREKSRGCWLTPLQVAEAEPPVWPPGQGWSRPADHIASSVMPFCSAQVVIVC